MSFVAHGTHDSPGPPASGAPAAGTAARAAAPARYLLPVTRRLTVLSALAALLALPAGCAGGGSDPPQLQVNADDEQALEKLGFPVAASRNTTRIGGGDAAADAAGAATAVFPSTSDRTRPSAVVIVGEEDWQGAVAAAALASAPIRAPMLLSGSEELPPVSAQAMDRLDPKGAELARGAQVIRVGDVPAPAPELRTGRLQGKDPYETAAAVDRFATSARGEPSDDVVVASGERPEFAMPAAAWAAYSGDSVLFTAKDRVPEATKKALAAHQRPNIYLLGPQSVISPGAERELAKIGPVRRVGAPNPVQNAVEFARFEQGGFGWGIKVPGYNFTLASTARPMDAAPAAALATNGVFAPLLLTDEADALPDALESYLLDIQPGYESDPRQGVYNRIWVLGDAETISTDVQGRLDELTELIPVEAEPEKGKPDGDDRGGDRDRGGRRGQGGGGPDGRGQGGGGQRGGQGGGPQGKGQGGGADGGGGGTGGGAGPGGAGGQADR